MIRNRRSLLAAMSAVLFSASISLGAASPAQANTPPALPSSYLAVGDSITRAFNVSTSCLLRDCPTSSWATATVSSVSSISARISAARGDTRLKSSNLAKTGAKMSGLDAQLKGALKSKPGFTTILMGANDVCSSSIATMTPVATFESQFQTALNNYFAGNPRGLVMVASIPNVYNLWSVLKDNSRAKSAWSLYGICQSMLRSTNTEDQRQTVLSHLNALNDSLEAVCASFTNCRYDGDAVFNTTFTASDVSTIDYFHPSLAGQTKLAGVAWAASYWGTP